MNGNPEGTPNPLNPVQGTRPIEPTPDTAAGTGMLDYSEPMVSSPSSSSTASGQYNNRPTSGSMDGFTRPAGFTRPVGSTDGFSRPATSASGHTGPSGNVGGFTRPAASIDGLAQPNGMAGNIGRLASVDGFNQPRAAHTAVDPMMRPSTRPVNAGPAPYDSFEALSSNDSGANFGAGMQAPAPAAAPELTAKDSIVEPSGGKGSKKKPMIVGAIILVIVAVACGAAAIVMAVMNSGGDKVSRAVEKLLGGQISNIVSLDGTINITPDASKDEVLLSSVNAKFNGTFDTATSLNEVSATVTGNAKAGGNLTLDISEITNKTGDTFIKVDGLNSLLNILTPALSANTTTTQTVEVTTSSPTVEISTTTPTVTIDTTTTTVDSTSTSTTTDNSAALVTLYREMVAEANNRWILLADNSTADDSVSSEIYNNPVTCAIKTIGSLGKYSSKIAKKYKQNPFITYSTDKMTLSKKKNDLYRIGVDKAKLQAFESSLDGDSFLETFNSCYDEITNGDDAFTIETLLEQPTIYVEIDDNYNFTRIYFDSEEMLLDSTGSGMVTADVNLSYPSELKVTEPDNYSYLSTIFTNASAKISSGNEGEGNTNGQ